ncbi:MAG TPA: PRC-barrel domain-containing protein [Pirellulaceae bacterium]|nr:PRC-barrel domain-containing protein [Pirellulaceae bacterium]
MLRTFSILCAGLAALSFLTGSAVAQQEAPAKPAAKGKVEVATTFRSGDLIGMKVKNRAGENLGQIEDLVVELKSGDIRYAALSFGGFAGFGDKLFAVPWQAMTFKFGENDRFFVFDVTQKELEAAPGFDRDRWPDVGNPEWSEGIDKHYSSKRTAAVDQAPRPAPSNELKEADASPADAIFRVSTIDGMNVRNDAGKDIGHVEELVLDIKSGKVKYAALSFGGFVGFGDKLFAIPMRAFTLKHGADETFFVLDISQDRLEKAPGFDKNNWPDTADPQWSAEIDKYYPERTAQRPTTRK